MNTEKNRLKRRDFLMMISGSVAAASLGAGHTSAPAYFNTGHQFDARYGTLLPNTLTPNAEFFSLTYGGTIPDFHLEDWSLTLDGLIVGETQILTWRDIHALPAHEETRTLECIGNPVGGHLIGTALWKGVPFSELQGRVRLSSGVTHVKFTAGDGYQTALPLSQLENALLAYQMNGEPLPQKHGFPLRLLVAGAYGQKMPKWITHISFIDHPFKGYWESRGWSERAEVETHAIITSPRDRAALNGNVIVQGIAFGGVRHITSVEIRVDGGAWLPAELTPRNTPLAWTSWALEWQPPTSGSYSLEVRATDETGFTQTQSNQALLGVRQKGSSSIHKIIVEVKL